jgi:hypothetical protein
MAEAIPQQDYYFLRTLVGYGKMEMFLRAEPDTPEGITEALQLDSREVMCTVSAPAPAVTYHSPFGLIFEGEVRACFDNDTGAVLQSDGTYNDHVFELTNPSTPEELMGDWYKNFIRRSDFFHWNEVILAKGSRVVGAFHDPRIERMDAHISACANPMEEYRRFMEKVQNCGLGLLDIISVHDLRGPESFYSSVHLPYPS